MAVRELITVTGNCEMGSLIARLRPDRPETRCDSQARRRVQVGTDLTADVCLWCSLVATERLSARLIFAPT